MFAAYLGNKPNSIVLAKVIKIEFGSDYLQATVADSLDTVVVVERERILAFKSDADAVESVEGMVDINVAVGALVNGIADSGDQVTADEIQAIWNALKD